MGGGREVLPMNTGQSTMLYNDNANVGKIVAVMILV
jgi:hypothetical protein